MVRFRPEIEMLLNVNVNFSEISTDCPNPLIEVDGALQIIHDERLSSTSEISISSSFVSYNACIGSDKDSSESCPFDQEKSGHNQTTPLISSSPQAASSIHVQALAIIQASPLTDEASYPAAGISKKHRNTTKRNNCVFCDKLVTKIARHLEKVHYNEERVKEMTNLPKGKFVSAIIVLLPHKTSHAFTQCRFCFIFNLSNY